MPRKTAYFIKLIREILNECFIGIGFNAVIDLETPRKLTLEAKSPQYIVN